MAYELRETVPDPKRYVELRDLADMNPKTLEAARRGLPNTVYGVVVVEMGTDGTGAGGVETDADGKEAENVVGMARIVGDEGCVYTICAMVVHPDHQGQGLGTELMDAIMAYVEENAPESAYVNLMADVDGFYEQWGFERTAPASKGMWLPSQ